MFRFSLEFFNKIWFILEKPRLFQIFFYIKGVIIMNETAIKSALKDFLCDNLGIEPDALENDTPLFGEGIGLDSIDSLEIIAFVDSEYGVQMTGVDKAHFYNIDAIAAYITENAEA